MFTYFFLGIVYGECHVILKSIIYYLYILTLLERQMPVTYQEENYQALYPEMPIIDIS